MYKICIYLDISKYIKIRSFLNINQSVTNQMKALVVSKIYNPGKICKGVICKTSKICNIFGGLSVKSPKIRSFLDISESVTIQMKALNEYIVMVLLVCNSEPVDKNPKCDHSNESS